MKWLDEINKPVDEELNTPLHLAALEGNLEEVKRLIKAGANPEAIDIYGQTPKEAIQEKQEKQSTLIGQVSSLIWTKIDYAPVVEYFIKLEDERRVQELQEKADFAIMDKETAAALKELEALEYEEDSPTPIKNDLIAELAKDLDRVENEFNNLKLKTPRSNNTELTDLEYAKMDLAFSKKGISIADIARATEPVMEKAQNKPRAKSAPPRGR